MNKEDLKEFVWTETAVSRFELDVYEIMDELYDLMISKHTDYGPTNISKSPGGPINGLRVRMHDKLARINNLVESGSDAQHEPLEDSFKDLANYAVIGMMVLREKWPQE
jgi:hypothetical protein